MPPYATFCVPSAPDLYHPNKVYSPAKGSSLPHVLLLISLPIAFASPPFAGRNIFFSSVIVALAVSAQFDPHFTNDLGVGQPFAQLWSVWFAALEKLFTASRTSHVGGRLVIGPESLFWRNKRGQREAESLAAFGPAKLLWSLALLFNLRGANWNYEVKNVPQLPATERRSRLHFLASRARKTLYTFFMADVVNQAWMQLFYVANTGSGYSDIGAVNSKYLTIRDPDWNWRLVKTVAWGPLPYYTISFQYNLMSLVAVATTLSDPEDWPPLFGALSKTTSVRAFWGQFWHQLIRRSFNTLTGYAVDTLHIPRGTVWSSQIQNWLAFFITSCLHVQCNLIVPTPSNISFREQADGMFQFFMLQALAISLEDAVQGTWDVVCRRSGVNRGNSVVSTIETVVGWMWVITSCWVSFPFAADMTLRFRFGDELMVPFSIVRPWVQHAFKVLREIDEHQ